MITTYDTIKMDFEESISQIFSPTHEGRVSTIALDAPRCLFVHNLHL
jgi:hypothetical protein